MSGFAIDAGGFGWIMGTPDEPGDRCLHGHAAAREYGFGTEAGI